MFLLGYDIGSSSIKATIIDAETGKVITSAFYPEKEMDIISLQKGWAEQDPEMWWENLKLVTKKLLLNFPYEVKEIKAIGIAYQMHGLVVVDKEQKVLRPSIIWCDSRAVEIGDKAAKEIGETKCLENLLNLPANFTTSKLKWVMENEPEVYSKIHKFMLPGDYIAMKMTGEIATTNTGLSEGILWDFKEDKRADFVLDYYGISKDFIPELVPVFGNQGSLTALAAKELGLAQGTLLTYRAGDQPNNAFALNVLKAGELAVNAGTSGVIYGVRGRHADQADRHAELVSASHNTKVNSFLHVNHTKGNPSYGVLACINGTGILYSWLKQNFAPNLSYQEMNLLATKAPVGADGLIILPFGNGAERILGNKDIGASLHGLNFNTHTLSHILRAAQEGIVFSLKYALDLMKETGVATTTIKACEANLFLSPLFCEAFATVTSATLELYKTDGAQGAARGAGVYKGASLIIEKVRNIEPDFSLKGMYEDSYQSWLKILKDSITT